LGGPRLILGHEEQPWSGCTKRPAGTGLALLRGTENCRYSRAPGRKPRRHLLECPANLAAELFPAFFHNDFLKLLTRIVPHFSATLPAPRWLRPGFGAPGPWLPSAHSAARGQRTLSSAPATCGRPEQRVARARAQHWPSAAKTLGWPTLPGSYSTCPTVRPVPGARLDRLPAHSAGTQIGTRSRERGRRLRTTTPRVCGTARTNFAAVQGSGPVLFFPPLLPPQPPPPPGHLGGGRRGPYLLAPPQPAARSTAPGPLGAPPPPPRAARPVPPLVAELPHSSAASRRDAAAASALAARGPGSPDRPRAPRNPRLTRRGAARADPRRGGGGRALHPTRGGAGGS
jgi:hypothetical protein